MRNVVRNALRNAAGLVVVRLHPMRIMTGSSSLKFMNADFRELHAAAVQHGPAIRAVIDVP